VQEFQIPGLGSIDSVVHPFSGSINEYQACLGTKPLKEFVRVRPAPPNRNTSAHAPQRPRSRKLSWGFVNGILETGGVMDKCVQMWTRNYGALGQTARVCFGVLCANRKKEEVKRDFGDEETGKKSEREKEEKRARKREGLIVGGRGEENPRVLLGDADQESETRMRKTPCGLDGDKLWKVEREVGVEVNGDQPKVEIKDMILQNDRNGMETIKVVTEGILEEEKKEEFELEKLRIRLRNKLNENKLKAGNRINDLANVCILSGKRTAEVSEPVNKCRPLNNPVVNKSVENATSCDFEKKNCDPPVRCTNVSHPSEVGRKEFNVNRSSDCDVEMKVGVCEGRVKTVAMGAQRVINLDNIGDGSFELKRDKGVANPEGLICENSCEEKYTLGTLVGCEKHLTVDRESFEIIQ
ncbi:uncharacterized protein TNCV_4962211, partial [Trichonephila clavipes]